LLFPFCQNCPPPSLPSLCPIVPPIRLGNTQFVNNYDGGDCFFVTVVKVIQTTTGTTAILDGYGESLNPFELLDEALHQIGVGANIGFHQITPSQCAAAKFLWRSRNQQEMVPHLDLVETKLRYGGMLTGTVANFGNRDVNLLMVADDGIVYNLTDREASRRHQVILC
jgi:serine/threonine-protein kinase